MKRCLCMIAAFLLCACSAPAAGAVEHAPVSAVIVSDLHYTAGKASGQIIPAMACIDELTRAMIHEVIALKPDMLILTGDNTNSGAPADAEQLCAYLQEAADAGIRVMVLPGNHDYDHADRGTLQELYGAFMQGDTADPYSLSYEVRLGGYALLAMDDYTDTSPSFGTFSGGTMGWLQQRLKAASDDGLQVIFLSHHNVIPGPDGTPGSIANPELSALLQRYPVALCLSGHQHSQVILQHRQLYEIISGMPAMAPHLYGRLLLTDHHITYDAVPLDLSVYGSAELADTLKEMDNQASNQLQEALGVMLEEQQVSRKEQEIFLSLLMDYFAWYETGQIAEHADAFRSPEWKKLLTVLDQTNYGPWIRAVISRPPLPSRHLELDR
ncbi:MAG: metallophosphoesterase [Solobacterium sp.]|nr:metallophosphoesterase [Solobacterium sp.]MBQ6531769.1 metallophosphoesterase [Solobacterium sp.]MBR0213272.1 metallophosphoesterase [Solobacterium sp.]